MKNCFFVIARRSRSKPGAGFLTSFGTSSAISVDREIAALPSVARNDNQGTDFSGSCNSITVLALSITGNAGILNFFFLSFWRLPTGILRLCSLKIALMLDLETLICSFSRSKTVKLRQLKCGEDCLLSRINLITSGFILWITPMKPPDWTFTKLNITSF